MPHDLDIAVKAHIDWLGRLMQALQRNHASAELRAETAGDCLFGQWLSEQAAEPGHTPADLQRISICHQAMHRLAAGLLQMSQGDESYYASLDRFCQTAIEFNRLVTALAPPTVQARHSA